VAVAFFAALLLLALKLTPVGPVHVQAYVRLGSPVSWSPPSTERLVVVPVTGLGAALAAAATVGAWLVTVTVLVPLNVPLLAVTVPLAELLGVVSRPLALIVPIAAVALQVNVGCVAIAPPNWSVAVAVNCCV
jgi:hypothetical protein